MPKKNELENNVKKAEKKVVKENKKVSEKKTASKKSTTKTRAQTTPKKTTTKKTAAKKVATTKKIDKNKEVPVKKNVNKITTKKTRTKKETVKKGMELKAEKIEDTVAKRKIEKLENNVEQKEKQIREKAQEVTVIEKIKSFLSKIVAMQEDSIEDVNKKSKDKKIVSKKTKKVTPDYLLEYYDLPYRYNETVVKILAQTPKRLFVYWDISDKDKEKYIRSFGEDFFYKTYPVLLLYNEDKKYIQEIPINDFANSWYIDIQDPKTRYTIQLGRKFIGEPQVVDMSTFEEENIILRTDYLPFADSNKLEVPNDHVLLEFLPRFITFRNVKTNQETVKDLKSFKDIFGFTYNVKEFYKSEYKEELSEQGMFDMANPSSALSSSSFK